MHLSQAATRWIVVYNTVAEWRSYYLVVGDEEVILGYEPADHAYPSGAMQLNDEGLDELKARLKNVVN